MPHLVFFRIASSSSSILPSYSVSSSSSSQPSYLFLLPLPLTLKLQHLFVFCLFLFLGAVRDIGDRESSLRVEDCLELLEDSVELLSKSLTSVAGGDVLTWLSRFVKDLSELVSNCLAGVPIQNRRMLMEEDSDISAIQDSTGFPKWLSRRERSLLQMPVSSIQADIIVSQDGNDTYKTIKNSPQSSTRRTIIYVKAGR